MVKLKYGVAESEDISGLVTEADTFENLAKKVKALIPELIEANRNKIKGYEDNKIPFHIVGHYCNITEFSSQ
jgi:hypothetical protein